MKKLLMTILIICFAALSACAPNNKPSVVVFENDAYTVSLQGPVDLKVTPLEEKTRTIENTVDRSQKFALKSNGKNIGTYEIVERILGNESTFLFERFHYEAEPSLSLKTSLTVKEDVRLQTTDWNPEIIEHPHHDVFGVDPTVNPFGRVTALGDKQATDFLVGHIFTSTLLERQYDGDKMSRIRELNAEITDVSVEEQTISKSFTIENGQIAESWFLVSDTPLFTSTEEENDYIDFALRNQESQLNWLTIDGPFTKLPFSIDPYTEMGYGRAIGRIEDDVALDWYHKSNSVFFESMVLNSRVNLQTYIEEFGGTRWPTEYTSTWLNNAYGVKAPYVDTRYNEYVAFFLDATAETFLEEVENPSLYVPIYADYLLSRVDNEEIIKAGNGYLIVDYFDEDPSTEITHASLNHELGGLKILLSAYGETGEVRYLNAANAIITGIESFGQDSGGWIRDNGDLWYQARPDGTFSGNDYPQLTLLDLLETQKLIEELSLPRVAYFDKMIESKLMYLANEDIELIEKVTNLIN